MERILISVMTYPTLSKKYFETVCTAGFREDGSWVRIFPVPLRLMKLQEEKTYRKWQWIEVNMKRYLNDERPESHHVDIDSIKPGKVISSKAWDIRWEFVKKNKPIFTDMSEVIRLAKENKLSLAVLKPKKILDVVCEKYTENDFANHRKKLADLEARLKAENMQLSLWDDTPANMKMQFRFAEMIPYKFKYRFITDDGKTRTLMIEDWEIVALYRNCIKSGDIEQVACQKVRDKYMKLATNNDVYFFLGTIFKRQRMNAANPFIIVGVFYPPRGTTQQLNIDFGE